MEEQTLSIEEIIREETEKRLAEMGKSDYIFPKSITKADVAVMIASIVASLLLIGLCMIGVVE